MEEEWVLFTSDRDGDWDIYMMRVDGTSLKRLTRQEGFDRWPSWVGEFQSATEEVNPNQ